MKKIVIILLLLVWSPFVNYGQTKDAMPFKAGAGKMDITPTISAFPEGVKLRDRLFVRAIVVDNGTTRVALVSADISNISDYYYHKFIQRIEKETGIPARNILISPSHSHSSFSLPVNPSITVSKAVDSFSSLSDSAKKAAIVNAVNAEFAANLENGIIEAVKQAKGQLQPAKIGYKTGTSYLNINRDAIDPVTRTWIQGPNYEGPSDKTVSVVTFATLTGEPIAVYYNYAMHINYLYLTGYISADAPGETSKYIEEYYDDKIIALWSMGAAGDQNPIYWNMQPNRVATGPKIAAAIAGGKAKTAEEAMTYIKNGGVVDVKLDPKFLVRRSQMLNTMGQMLGEEVLRVMKGTVQLDSKMKIFVSNATLTYPGRDRTNTGRQGAPGTYIDGDSVKIGLCLVVLNDIAFTTVNAEVYNQIFQRLKKESPYTKILMATHTNGRANSGYIPSDDAFARYTFQVLGTRLKPGYAEAGIINKFIEMMKKANGIE